MSSTTFNKAVIQLWPDLNPDWYTFMRLYLVKNLLICTCKMDSKTFDKKGKMAIGRYSFGDFGIGLIQESHNSE